MRLLECEKTKRGLLMRLTGNQRRHRLAHAFTLVEVLVATGILATISLAYYGALSSGFGVMQSTREDLRATQILVQRIEAVRLCPWRQLTNFSFRETYDPLAPNQVAGAMYYGSVTTNAATSIGNSVSYKPNMRLVTVSVFWINYTGRRPQVHMRQMQTEVARYGLQNYLWGLQ
jgi:prepilin-type N-terminal cleavage/methylation domain-containing protein